MASSKPSPPQGEVFPALDDSTAKFLTPGNPGFPYASAYTCVQPRGATAFQMVRLLPGSGNDRIQCELIASSLSPKAPSYEVLSYCAGDASDRKSVMLDGHDFNTFRTTFEALCQLRHAESSRDLWIDQISINQTDIDERDNQFLLMRDIQSCNTYTYLAGRCCQKSAH